MVEENPPEFLGAECYTFEDFRQAFNGVVCVEGVTATGDLLVTAAGGASIDVNVAAGTAWVEGNLNGAEGMYHVSNDASVAVTIAANGAGSSRIDLILATVYDSQYIGASDAWAIEVVQGVAGAGVPAVPASTRAGYLILGHVTVPASGGTPSVVSELADVMETCGKAVESDFPYALIKASGTTSIPTFAAGQTTTISLPTTVHADTEYFTVGTDTITIVETGLYDISYANTITVGSPGAWIGTGVTKNATTYASLFAWTESGDDDWSFSVDTTHSGEALTAGDVLRLGGYHNSASSKNASSGRLMVRKVG